VMGRANSFSATEITEFTEDGYFYELQNTFSVFSVCSVAKKQRMNRPWVTGFRF